MKRVLILGGGVGGTVVANLLAKRLHPDEVEISVVDKTGRHVYQPGFVYVAFQGLRPKKLVRDERKLLRRRVKLVLGEIVRIDSQARRVFLKDGTHLEYDLLVVALGASLTPEELPGYQEAAHHFYTLEASVRLHQALAAFRGGKVVVSVASVPYKCPPAPSEAACQLDYYFTRRGMRERVEIEYLSPLSRVFPLEPVNPVVEEIFANHGIHSKVFFNVDSIDPKTRTVQSIEGETTGYDLLILVPPHRGSEVIEASGLGDRGGWLPVDKHTMRSKEHPEIFGLGDCTDVPVSKSGAAAHFQAKVVAESIVAELRGRPPPEPYDGHVMCLCDAGYHRALAMEFDYNHPPPRPNLNRWNWFKKSLLNRAYWFLIPPARV